MFESNDLTDVWSWSVYGLSEIKKRDLHLKYLSDLTEFHANGCAEYKIILTKLYGSQTIDSLEKIPFLPVRLFKHYKLLSIPQSEVLKTMTSSGTGGQAVSQIFLDKETSAMQVKALSRIMSDFLGPTRLPMLVIDCKSTVSDRLKFSARTAGILGFGMFGKDLEFALDDDMNLNVDRIQNFVKKYPNQPILLFGFTFIVWLHFIKQLELLRIKLPLDNGILIHGGGWKKIQSEAVELSEFKKRLKIVSGVQRVHNYYGMVEQTGSIFMECDQGNMHASSWSNIIIRDPITFKPMPVGQSGLIQILSVIPKSYPGHSLLSEDEGQILGVDNCLCGRLGSYFRVHGRIQDAEMRGCSDTYSR